MSRPNETNVQDNVVDVDDIDTELMDDSVDVDLDLESHVDVDIDIDLVSSSDIASYDYGEAEDGVDTDTEVPSADERVVMELEEDIYAEIDAYIANNLVEYAKPTFHIDLIQEVTEIIYDGAVQINLLEFGNDHDREMVKQEVQLCCDTYFDAARIYPIRSYPPHTRLEDIVVHPTAISTNLRDQVEYLSSLPQPVQRTPEWYKMRYNLITASNIYKALGTDAQRNSLICEKCAPLIVREEHNYVNTETSTHHGNRYETVTAMIYEAMYPQNTLKTDFGCIQHRDWPFIGASPDGIVTEGDRLGHMVEIKNVVSREISDTPILSHWVQCQVQMETCDLGFCDYIQTSIKEFPDAAAYYADQDVKYKGVILHFISKTLGGADYHYEYMPICSSSRSSGASADITQTETWIDEQVAKHAAKYSLYQTLYWKLVQCSCVIIPRNRAWFQAVLPKFVDIWHKIEHERIHGYEHRLPKRREPRRPVHQCNLALLEACQEARDDFEEPGWDQGGAPTVFKVNKLE
jgi:hypothetical protein